MYTYSLWNPPIGSQPPKESSPLQPNCNCKAKAENAVAVHQLGSFASVFNGSGRLLDGSWSFPEAVGRLFGGSRRLSAALGFALEHRLEHFASRLAGM